MNGWRLAVALGIAVGLGYFLRSWKCLIRCGAVRVRLLVAEANQNHALCKVAENALSKYAAQVEARNADLEVRLDAFEQAGRVVDEAERITRGEP